MKKLNYFILLLVVVLVFSSCGGRNTEENKTTGTAAAYGETGKITVIASLFPQFDFAREIGGDKAEVVLLLPPGAESHIYEPSPRDMVKILNSDIFLFSSPEMEPWAKKIAVSNEMKNPPFDCSKGIDLLQEHEEEYPMQEESHDAVHPQDLHYWNDPCLAEIMVKNILDAFIYADPGNESYYRERASIYQKKLTALDEKIRIELKNCDKREIVVGGRFSFYWFAKRYGLDYIAAYDGCNVETEPGPKRIMEIINTVKDKRLPFIYHEELTPSKTALSIVEDTGAALLPLYSCHNITQQQFDEGASYISLMNENLNNILRGLV